MKPYASPDWNDDRLLDLIRLEDDRTAFTELYERYWDVLVDAAYKRLRSRETAHELVQDIFVSFFLRRRQIVLRSTLEAYLKTAVRNQVFKAYLAQQIHRVELDSMLEKEQNGTVLPDQLLEAKQLQQRIEHATKSLPEKCRAVFVLSRYENLSQRDIALKLDISVSTVKKHLTKALSLLRSEVKDHQVDLMAFLLFINLHR